MIYRIILGQTANQYKIDSGLGVSDSLRDNLLSTQIEAVEHLQRLNTSLIELGFEYQDRKEKLTQMFDKKHNLKITEQYNRLEA